MIVLEYFTVKPFLTVVVSKEFFLAVAAVCKLRFWARLKGYSLTWT